MIFKENGSFQDVFFVKKGDILLSKSVFLAKNDPIFEKMETTKMNRLLRFLNFKILPVAICGENELIGFEGFLEHSKENNYYSATCISKEATIYCISKDTLTVLLPEFEQNCAKFYESKFKSRISRFLESIEKIAIASAEFLIEKTNPMLCLTEDFQVKKNLDKFLGSTIFNRLKEIQSGFLLITSKNKKTKIETDEDVDPFETLSKQQQQFFGQKKQSFQKLATEYSSQGFALKFRNTLDRKNEFILKNPLRSVHIQR